MTVSVHCQDSQNPSTGRLADAIAQLGGRHRFERFRAAVAYARLAGTESLVNSLKEHGTDLPKIKSQWLVGIDFGRTQPEALEFLRRLRGSEVRVPDGEELLARRLNPRTCFHPKSFAFDTPNAAGRSPFGILIGSGNLSWSGLNRGAEHAISLYGTRTSLSATFNSWWEGAWTSATPSDGQFLRRYRTLAHNLPTFEDNAADVTSYLGSGAVEIDRTLGAKYATARFFWIETRDLYQNRGHGNPGNQLDTPRGTRCYFGAPPTSVPRNSPLAEVWMKFASHNYVDRHLRYGNNQMDKVDLPIPGASGPPRYDHQFLRFERVRRGRFVITLGSRSDVRRWRAKSQALGLYATMGNRGREYGFYS